MFWYWIQQQKKLSYDWSAVELWILKASWGWSFTKHIIYCLLHTKPPIKEGFVPPELNVLYSEQNLFSWSTLRCNTSRSQLRSHAICNINQRQFYAARGNHSIAQRVFYVGNSVKLDVTSGRETNLEMDVYQQGLASEKSSCCQVDNPHGTMLAIATHRQNCTHIWGRPPAVAYANTCQFIMKMNARVSGPSSTCHPNKTEPMEVIWLLSISLTPSGSLRHRGSWAFTVVCHACRKIDIRGENRSLMDGLMK